MVFGDYVYRALCDSVANGMYAWLNWASAQTLTFRSVGSSAQPACGSLQIASKKLFDLHRKQTWHNSHCKIATRTVPCTFKVVEPTSSTSSLPNLSTLGIHEKKCRVDGSTTQNYSYQLVQYGKRMESLQCSGPSYSENFPFDFLFRKLSMYSYMYVKTESASVQHDCAIYCGQLSAIVCGLRHLLWLIVCNCMWFAPSIVAILGVAPSTRSASRTVFCCSLEKIAILHFACI